MVKLKAQREDEGQHELDQRLAIAQELCVGGLIVDIDGESAVLAFGFGGLCHVSSPYRRWWVRMRHGEVNMLKWQAYRERMRALPRNSVESGLFFRQRRMAEEFQLRQGGDIDGMVRGEEGLQCCDRRRFVIGVVNNGIGIEDIHRV